MARRCFASPENAGEARAIASRAAAANRRNIAISLWFISSLLRGACHRARIRAIRWLAMTVVRSRLDQRIAVFGQMQDLRDADLDRRCDGNEFGPLSVLAFERIDGVEADIDTDALRHQALDSLAGGIVGLEQIDTGAKCHDLDR